MSYARWHLTWASNTKLQGRIRTLSKKCVTIGRFELHCPCRAQAQISRKIEADFLKFGLPASSRQLQDSSFEFRGQLFQIIFQIPSKINRVSVPWKEILRFLLRGFRVIYQQYFSQFWGSGATPEQYKSVPGALGFTPGAPKSVQISIWMTPGALRITPGAPESPPRPPESVQISISVPLGLWEYSFYFNSGVN